MLNKLKTSRIICVFFAIVFAPMALAADYWQMNMYQGVTPISRDMYDLHMIAILVCAIIGIIVFGVMFYSLIKHRKSKGHQAALFHGHTLLEVVWTIIPFLILLSLAVPATKVLIRMDDTSNADVTIKVVGYQWKWSYQYMDQGISYFSVLSTPYAQIQNNAPKNQWYLLEVDKPLVVPVNKKIRFLVTSNDVIHSWWVPELGIKRDAIPGFMHEAWARIDKPGTYRGQCTELCGLYHGFMPIVVEAVTQEEFDAWVKTEAKLELNNNSQNLNPIAADKMTRSELMKIGKEKYELVCLPCHQENGKGIPPMYPALKGSSIAVGKPISRHINTILNGVPGSAMQAYADQLSDVEIAAIATYERNAWDNNTNDEIQPSDVATVRKGNYKQPKLVKKARTGGLQ